MKKKNKVMLTLLSVVLTLSLLSACGSSSNANNSEVSNESVALENGKYVDPVTITAVFPISSALKFKNGENIENNVHTKWAKDRLNIDIKYLWTVSDQNNAYETKLRLMLTSGQKMPDIISYRGDHSLINDLVESGQFADVGELFDQYASEGYKAAMNEDSGVWNPYIFNGKRMGIPLLENAYNNDPVMYIREDWLNKLDLKAPTTLEELEVVMDAFVNQDPDGNGDKDTIALSVGFKNSLNAYMSDSSWIFGMFGAMPDQWNLTENDGLEYGSIQPEVKLGLAKMKEWMEKGYIDKESGLHDEVKATESFTAGKSGIIVGPYWMTGWPLPETKANVPGAAYKAYSLPVGPDGTTKRHGTKTSNGAILVNKDMKNKDALFVYLNYLYDNFANPSEDSEFKYGFAEGYDYAVGPNGEVYGETDADKIPGGWIDAVRYSLNFDGAIIPSLRLNILAELARGKEPETIFEQNLAKSITEQIEASRIVIEQIDIIEPEMFVGSRTKTMVSKGELLEKLEEEVITKIIYGNEPLDEFDVFVERYLSSGGQEIHDEVNEWYDSVKQ